MFEERTESLVWAGLFLLVFLVLGILNSFFIKSYKKIAVLAVVATILLGTPFYDLLYPGVSWFLLGGLGVFLVLFLAAFKRARLVINNSLKIQFFNTATRFLSVAVTAVLLFISTTAFVVYFEKGRGGADLAKRLTLAAVQSSDALVKIWWPDFSSGAATEDFIRLLAEEQISRSGLGVNQLAGQTQVLDEAVRQISQNLEKSLGEFSAKAPLGETIYGGLANYFKGLSENTQLIFGAGVILLLFLTLKGAAALLYGPVAFFAHLLFRILLAIRFSHIGAETRNREFVIVP